MAALRTPPKAKASTKEAEEGGRQCPGPQPSDEVKALTSLLRNGQYKEFLEEAEGERPDLQNAELRFADLRGAPLEKADLRGAYLRRSDLRGLDLIDADLDGASIHDARIGGTRFPRDLSANEILLSLTHGTRMRAAKSEP